DNLYYLNSGKNAISNNAESDMHMNELNQLVLDLDDSLRVPFQMHFDGFKYQEIVDALSLPLGTVKSRIFFARKELKERIGYQYSGIYERETGFRKHA
ncbi:MAG: sigma factor-like helix-turn-helix DNA-binding protein, partial [Saprospiraceae bacterium]